ncbi:hypothetical protein SAMN05518669_11016 [Variovorax sp. YR634]|uniref:hypothetical protein n=1 Tax=Variovorax sp. YR634 TaxID=1884385 RepID=UPI00089C2855|nr:hypothetical protein [Variovorax sp. YR634]SDY18954.1 hypothetical protein SAMN05518669_11016 [Variovorax sp. YR634]
MKVSETTSFPHPVLAPWSTDFDGISFTSQISFRENPDDNQVSLHCAATLDQPDIAHLIQEGLATFGCYIKCHDTGMRRLQEFGFPSGIRHFAPGALLGNVQLRPMVWSIQAIESYRPAGVHAEFSGTFSIAPGQILALGEEQVIEVTRPPLPTIESIFEIVLSKEVGENEFEIDTEHDRITVLMGERTFQLVQGLRQADETTRAVAMNSVYVPVVMQVLVQLAEGSEHFEQYRWLHPFLERCRLSNVDIGKPDLLTDAQRLLAHPFASLAQMIEQEDAVDVAAS